MEKFIAFKCEKHDLVYPSEVGCPICKDDEFMNGENIQRLDVGVVSIFKSHLETKRAISKFTFDAIHQKDYQIRQLEAELNKLAKENEKHKDKLREFNKAIRDEVPYKTLQLEVDRILSIVINKSMEKTFNVYLSKFPVGSEDLIDTFRIRFKSSFKKLSIYDKIMSKVLMISLKKSFQDSLENTFNHFSEHRNLKRYQERHARKVEKIIRSHLSEIMNKLYKDTLEMMIMRLRKKEDTFHRDSRIFAYFLIFFASGILSSVLIRILSLKLEEISTFWTIAPLSLLVFASIGLIYYGVTNFRSNINDIISSKRIGTSKSSIEELFDQLTNGLNLTTEKTKKLNELKTEVIKLIKSNQE